MDDEYQSFYQSSVLRSKPRTTKELIGYVYVIDYGDGKTFKIGRTTDEPEKRFGQITRGTVIMPMHLVMASGVLDNCAYVESLLHMRFSFKHVNGEWFKLDIHELVDVYKCFRALTIDKRTVVYDRWYELVPKGFQYWHSETAMSVPFLTQRERFEMCLNEVKEDMEAYRNDRYGPTTYEIASLSAYHYGLSEKEEEALMNYFNITD